MHYFLHQNVLIFPFYILLGRIDTFWSDGIKTVWYGGIGTVFRRKSRIKNQQKLQRFLEFHQLLCIIFYDNLHQISHFTLYFHTTQTTYYFTNPILCHYPLQLIYFLLSYATRTNSTLRSNLNYKKLLNCVNTTNFLLVNLNYEFTLKKS